MEPEINDDEVLSDCESSSTRRPSSADSFDMPRVNLPPMRPSLSQGQISNDLSRSTTKLSKEQKPMKVLVVHGKCSQVFKSTLEECVEDCILEFTGESNSVYVSKSGQTISIPAGYNRNTINSFRDPTDTQRQSVRSNRARNSTNQFNFNLPQIGSTRNSLTNNFSLPTTALAASTAARLRHPLVHQRFTRVENISEETSEQQTVVDEPPVRMNIESGEQSKRPPFLTDRSISPHPNIASASLPSFPSTGISSSYRNRQKGYRLSDLVMFGPEKFADVFNLPRHQSQQQNRKTTEKLTELDRVKQDLFHRYLWTQNPQVSCRIRPMSSYSRSSTFVI